MQCVDSDGLSCLNINLVRGHAKTLLFTPKDFVIHDDLLLFRSNLLTFSEIKELGAGSLHLNESLYTPLTEFFGFLLCTPTLITKILRVKIIARLFKILVQHSQPIYIFGTFVYDFCYPFSELGQLLFKTGHFY